jgi:kumamolisin
MPLLSLNPVYAASLAPTASIGETSPLVARSQKIGEANAEQQLALSIQLSLRNVSALQSSISAIYMSGSSLYHHYLRPQQFAALYGPTANEVQQVTQYLQAQGFNVTRAVAGEQVIDFSGTVGQAERAFSVTISTYRARDGRLFYANSTAPRVPLNLRPYILNISGLSNVVIRQHPPINAHALQTAKLNATSCPGPGSNYLTPAQFATAYNFNAAYNAGYRGEGQSIALFELDSYTPGDISGYQACFDGNSPTRIQTTLIDGGPGSQTAGGLEVELDMDLLLGMLPHLSNLFVYEAPNNDTGYNDEWSQILADDVPIVSTSWGMCESGLSASNINAEAQFFMQAAMQGQTLLAASGDNGAYDCGDTNLAVDDPASNPYMTGVGGTHLAVNSNSSYNSESVWSSTPNTYNGSGGGISQLWSMPGYQSGPGVLNSYSSGSPCHASSGQYCREVPDVAMNADPNVGYLVYCTIQMAGCSSSYPFVRVGGTSAAAPMWAAIVALANQYALIQGGNNLGFLNPTLYTLLHNNSLYSSAFHDVASGNNLYYPATSGYDMATGIGSANAYNFIHAAVSSPGQRNVPGNTRWYFAEGHTGDNFQEYLTLENPNVGRAAHAVVNYLLRGKPSFNQSLTLNPSSRTTVNVNNMLRVPNYAVPGQDVSLYITSDIPIVAERPIYFVFLHNTQGGSDVLGTSTPGMHFTFANGETLSGFSTYISVLNPLGQPTATVTATYYSGGVRIGQSTMSVPSGQRNTLMANNSLPVGKQFLIQIDSTQPIVVERPMYFHTSVPGVASLVQGGDSVPGVLPAASWYFADGYTGNNTHPSQENLILANPDANNSGSAASVTITYAFTNGGTKNVNVSVPARSQLIENVNSDVGSGALVAMKIVSTNGITIVAERQQFFYYPALAPQPTGVEVVGVSPGNNGLSNVYSFAEGHLGNSFSENITLFNPNNAGVNVSITYFVTRGSTQTVSQQQVYLAPTSVLQVNANTFLNIPANSSGSIPEDTSVVVQSLPVNGGSALPIVAERALYFDFMNSISGSTSVIGYTGS